MDNQKGLINLRLALANAERERDEYKKHAADFEELYKQEHREKNAIQRDKAALIEVLEWYGETGRYFTYQYGQMIEVDTGGKKARDILSRMK